ncbi:MAG TPA: bifunctional phosphoribosylaminoimidazolecarboxamide formyltransferase/IMP cyclohydrolase, partial [Xanthomonadales bacterium]|nr:bifunctional phosphoribosylaminoimidazolecarboxamide formyltransferase/IMP cyclohydrolase [Xanthomonadales bacterium]
AHGTELVSTGGTARALRDAGIAVREVSELTRFPEIMDGRVKTLHPSVHGALLGRSGIDDAVMREHGIAPIDLLVVNLYPFERTVAATNCTLDEAVEQIDIGGPAMLRAAAKNHERVSVVVDPSDYDTLVASLAHGGPDATQRRALAAKAYAHTSRYDGRVAMWLGARANESGTAARFAPTLTLDFERGQQLRYGENPHQSGALYVERDAPSGVVAGATLRSGKELSYNNLADADAALECVKQLGTSTPACVIVKHANPCGAALGPDLAEAYERAYATDPVSAFGGIIAFNAAPDAALVERILARQFVEVLVAPEFGGAALAAARAKPNVRLLETGAWGEAAAALDFKRIAGGVLVQDADRDAVTRESLEAVTKRKPTTDELDDLLFAWRVAMFVKSNAIVYVRGHRTIGIGAGQMSRVVSAKIAALKAEEAKLEVPGSVMASDAFFPFRDGIDAAAAAGVRAVIQPGGSMRDKEVVAAADEHGLAMVFTRTRHFRH